MPVFDINTNLKVQGMKVKLRFQIHANSSRAYYLSRTLDVFIANEASLLSVLEEDQET